MNPSFMFFPIPDVVVDNVDVVVVVEVDADDIVDNVDDSVVSVPAGRGVGAANLMFGEWFTLRYITDQQRAATTTHCFCRFVRLL